MENKIGLTGHSRNGKQALVAAGFDERIGAVALSSGNTGEVDPWRYTTDMFVNESIELLTGAQPHWFHPRLRFFAGREDKLPVDQNLLMAAIAPRGLMMFAGYAESAGNPFGFEQAYRSVLSAYRFLGHEENLWLHLRDGEHEFGAERIEEIVDFFDAVFGRNNFPKRETWILGYTFEGWQKASGEKIDRVHVSEKNGWRFSDAGRRPPHRLGCRVGGKEEGHPPEYFRGAGRSAAPTSFSGQPQHFRPDFGDGRLAGNPVPPPGERRLGRLRRSLRAGETGTRRESVQQASRLEIP